ncbi:MAG: fibronectin type III domain-containing protein, partial [Nitrosopumilus sp.]|nr:fibronectin type III domain-containing protein [Nitrosopumilus sp.]
MLFSLTLLVEPSITASAAQSELFSPRNLRVSNVTSDSLVLSWDPVSEATYYDVKVVSTTGRHSVVFIDPQVTSTSITITGLHTDNEYDLMVSSRNDTQSSVAK